MNDIQREQLKRRIVQAEIDLFANKYGHSDQAVSDPEFYRRRTELNELKDLLKEHN